MVFTAILHDTAVDLVDFGIGWGLAVTIAVFDGASMSGAHFNPSENLTMAMHGLFPWIYILQYFDSQIARGVLSAMTLFGLYSEIFCDFVAMKGGVHGQPNSQHALAIFVPLASHPVGKGRDSVAYAKVMFLQGASMMSLLRLYAARVLESRIFTYVIRFGIMVLLGLRDDMWVTVLAPVVGMTAIPLLL